MTLIISSPGRPGRNPEGSAYSVTPRAGGRGRGASGFRTYFRTWRPSFDLYRARAAAASQGRHQDRRPPDLEASAVNCSSGRLSWQCGHRAVLGGAGSMRFIVQVSPVIAAVTIQECAFSHSLGSITRRRDNSGMVKIICDRGVICGAAYSGRTGGGNYSEQTVRSTPRRHFRNDVSNCRERDTKRAGGRPRSTTGALAGKILELSAFPQVKGLINLGLPLDIGGRD
jgi:hypothetical protein